MSTVSVYEQVIRGNAKQLTATFTDPNGNLIDADSHVITIYDGNGLVQDKITMPTRDSLGTYHYWYTVSATTTAITPPANKWRVVWQMLKGGTPSAGDQFFIVTA